MSYTYSDTQYKNIKMNKRFHLFVISLLSDKACLTEWLTFPFLLPLRDGDLFYSDWNWQQVVQIK